MISILLKFKKKTVREARHADSAHVEGLLGGGEEEGERDRQTETEGDRETWKNAFLLGGAVGKRGGTGGTFLLKGDVAQVHRLQSDVAVIGP